MFTRYLKWFWIFLIIFVSNCTKSLPAKTSIVQTFDSQHITVMFWQNDDYLWIGNKNGITRLNVTERKADIFPGIDCTSSLVTYNPEAIWCSSDRFDGKMWQETGEKFYKLIQSQDGMIWAGGEKGLAQFDSIQKKWIYAIRDKSSRYRSPIIFNTGPPGIHLAMESQDGSLWFYSYDDNYLGINRWSPHFHRNWFLGGDDSMMLPRLETNDGFVWATQYPAYENKIARWNGQTWQFMTPFQVMNNQPDLIEANDGSVWIATGFSEVGQWDNLTWHIWSPFPDVSNITGVFQTQDESIWVMSSQNGVARWKNQKWQIWSKEQITSQSASNYVETEAPIPSTRKSDDLYSPNIPRQAVANPIATKHFLEDTDGNVWYVLSEQEGISRWTGNFWLHYTANDGLSSNDVSILTMSPDGDLWAGTYGGGVNYYDPDTDRWQPFPLKE